jgi:hypothetical protein
MAGPDFNIIKPELAGSFGAGYRASQENRMATEENQIKLDQLKSDRQAMIQLQEQLKAAGHDPDLNKVFDAMISTGKPDYVIKGMDGKKRLQAQSEFAKMMGLDIPGAAPAAPMAAPGAPMAAPGAPMAAPGAPMAAPEVAPVNALGGAPAPVAPAAPANALAGGPVRPAAPMAAPGAAPVNAMVGGNQPLIEQTRTRINNLMNYAARNAGTPEGTQAIQQARIMQDQLELYSKKPSGLQEISDYMNMTPEQKAVFEKIHKIKNPGTTIVNAPTAKSLSEPVGKRVEASLAKAEGASGMRENANMVQEALNSGKVIAGPMAGPRTTIAQLLNMAGADNRDQLQNSLTVAKGLAGLTLESRGELKGQGQITDPETKLLEKARSGDTNLTLDELQQVVNISNRMSKRLWENHQTLLKTMEADPSAAGSINYYRPTAPLAEPVGNKAATSKTPADQSRKPLADIFKK